eukprot:comp112874_c0_seq1/m.48864 comp112874_c0_seq1/g.48864  ORF comp112874_c0_seq1/g.48864 comp112874_c0_seq1/m.48864 type:complete len:370 (-) comp112874_c0_seq1:42-1151(-)
MPPLPLRLGGTHFPKQAGMLGHRFPRLHCVRLPRLPVRHMSRTTPAKQAGQTGKQLRSVMKGVPSPVVVVTTASRGKMRGFTCSSFTSVSLAPPIVSFCLRTPSRMHELITEAKQFAVNIISASQAGLGMHFAKPLPPRPNQNADSVGCQFEGIPHHIDPQSGLPVLHGALGILFCSPHTTHMVGDHAVWYGNVERVEEGLGGQPLLYYAGTFRSVGEEEFMKHFEDATLAFERWTHIAHVRMAWNYLRQHGLKGAVPLIREGIKRYNAANAARINHGYNETITLFYAHIICTALQKDAMDIKPEESFGDFIMRHPNLAAPNLIYNYYSRDLVLGPSAKASWTEPDLKPCPFSVDPTVLCEELCTKPRT